MLRAIDSFQDKILLIGFEIEISTINRADWGRWNRNNEVTIVVTKFGVLLIKEGYLDDPDTLEAIAQLCPKGRGEFVSSALQDML
jgi:hypothetical protein